jgi:hypothetical protein
MDANELQAKLRKLERLMDQQRVTNDVQNLDVANLRAQVRQLTSDKQELEAERQKLSSQLKRLTKKPGSK